MTFQWSLELQQESTDKKAGKKAVQEEQEMCKRCQCSRRAMTSGAQEEDDDGNDQKVL